MLDDGVIDLRKDKKSAGTAGAASDDVGEPEFKIERRYEPPVESMPVNEVESAATKPYDKVKVKFDKFVHLVVTHAYEEVFEKHRGQDVVISTDLLTDLANARGEKTDKKSPLLFVFGVLLGVGVAWLILKS
ncbi:hypothetical protein HYW82_00995 [Candidatus Peregrinibacteria bacterium]|nr:hypothetical protein [Candidatus Peregrinibacteria bacterium]